MLFFKKSKGKKMSAPACWYKQECTLDGGQCPPLTRVPQTVGNRTGLTGNWSGPVPVWSGMKPVQIQNLNLNLRKLKIPKKFLKILQGATNLMVSNFLKNSFI